MNKTIAVLSGDGIGPEIMAEALKALRRIEEVYGHAFDYREGLIGGAAWEQHGRHCPDETLALCGDADAILFGCVGGPVESLTEPKWKDCERNTVLRLRQEFRFAINLRPIKVYPALSAGCPLRAELIGDGVDILCVRELTGGIYFGEHSTTGGAGERRATDVMSYDEAAIRLVAKAAFEAAGTRRRLVTSVDKANVLDCSRLWRDVVGEVAGDYRECRVEHMLVDNCAMQAISNPRRFDVLLMPNMFGDILSDELSVLSGSLGMLPSASLDSAGKGLYEPAGGSAHDIAGQGVANPTAQILSAAMMLRHSFGLEREAAAIESAVDQAMDRGLGTRDIRSEDPVSTTAFGDVVTAFIN